MATFVEGPLHGRTVPENAPAHLVLRDRPAADAEPVLLPDDGHTAGDCYSLQPDGTYRYTGQRV